MAKQAFNNGAFLEAILTLAQEDSLCLPTAKEFILSEFCNGVIQYIGGNAGLVTYRPYRLGRLRIFEFDIWSYLERELVSDSAHKLSPRVRAAVTGLAGYKENDPGGPGKSYPYPTLYLHFSGWCGTGICPITLQKWFKLSDTSTFQAAEWLGRQKKAEQREIEGIARSMVPIIQEDVAYLKGIYYGN